MAHPTLGEYFRWTTAANAVSVFNSSPVQFTADLGGTLGNVTGTILAFIPAAGMKTVHLILAAIGDMFALIEVKNSNKRAVEAEAEARRGVDEAQAALARLTADAPVDARRAYQNRVEAAQARLNNTTERCQYFGRFFAIWKKDSVFHKEAKDGVEGNTSLLCGGEAGESMGIAVGRIIAYIPAKIAMLFVTAGCFAGDAVTSPYTWYAEHHAFHARQVPVVAE